MPKSTRLNIDFMGLRKFFFLASAVLLAVSIGALAVRGLTFSVEFIGGTVIDVTNAGEVTIDEMRSALQAAGVENAQVQTTVIEGNNGFIVRTEVTDPDQAASDAAAVAEDLGLNRDVFQVKTIGPGWGRNVTNAALLALAVSIGFILLYISIRFDYKMSITAVIALIHDILITLGIYALIGAEVSPNTIAALLTILGYSLYDTIVVFHRIKENTQHLGKQTFMQMANESINEVFVRSINTTLTSLIPVISLLVFGGSVLNDFALALTIGLLVGAYSSIGVASPLYAMWKETEPKYAALKKKYAEA